ncbi:MULTISPECIES: transporter substrate-binding domain-containing protein [Methylobacterium]|uniref:transporter substrate-binding domain-containing protein n=1 Tax=Methylobacterium TaxID=407 RepID=UPI00357161BE
MVGTIEDRSSSLAGPNRVRQRQWRYSCAVSPAAKRITGLDLDYAQAVADKPGVKLEVRPTNPANRIPLLTSGNVDLVLANSTITEERARQLDFSIPYFASGQQFLAKKGTLSSPDQLNELRIGADKGTTNEIVLRRDFPKATVVAFDDTPFALSALRNGNV